MSDETVTLRYAMAEPLAEEILGRLQQEVGNLGFEAAEASLLMPGEAVYRLEKDPANGEYSLVGDWLDEQGMKLGCLLFHSDGSFFVEQDIAKPHPKKAQWFVEAVHAWGRDGDIRAEARLLRMPPE